MIAWCMSHKKLILIGAAVIFAIVIAIYVPRMKTEYFPTADQGRIQVSVELPIGTAQDVTRDLAERLYAKIVEDVPEIKVLSYNFGQADSQNAFASMRNNGAYLISMNINIGSMENRKRSTSEIADLIRSDLRLFPEINKSTVTEGGMGMGGRSAVQLEIYGYDVEATETAARKIREKMLENPNFVQVVLSRDQCTPEYEVDFDREKLALNGLTSTTAAAAVSAAMSGTARSTTSASVSRRSSAGAWRISRTSSSTTPRAAASRCATSAPSWNPRSRPPSPARTATATSPSPA